MIKIEIFTFNPFQENTYLLYDESKEAIIIDPGCYEKEEKEELLNFIKENDLKITQLLNTHCHIDHVLGNAFVKQKFNVPLIIHSREEMILRAVKTYSSNYGFAQYQEADFDKFVDEGEQIKFGNSTLDILFVPGHSPGHVAFYNLKEKICISGDVLFNRSIGRTDLPGGNFETLIKSITDKMFKLPDDMIVYPGHGPATNIADEKKYNPFLNQRSSK